jgi:hypothetical protein
MGSGLICTILNSHQGRGPILRIAQIACPSSTSSLFHLVALDVAAQIMTREHGTALEAGATLNHYQIISPPGAEFLKKWSGRRGSNSQLSAWEVKFSILYFQYLQNAAEKMYVHALHTVHALPDFACRWGRLGDGVSLSI